MPALIVAPGANIPLSDFHWVHRELAITLAGPLSDELMSACPTVEGQVARHEAAHCTVSFLLGGTVYGASIVPVEGHSLGRASARIPLPGEKSICDQQRTDDYVFLSGGRFDLGEIDAFVTTLLTDYWPLVRRLAGVLLARKVLPARRCRQVLFRAMKKDLRRARALAERDRREQQTFARVFQDALHAAPVV